MEAAASASVYVRWENEKPAAAAMTGLKAVGEVFRAPAPFRQTLILSEPLFHSPGFCCASAGPVRPEDTLSVTSAESHRTSGGPRSPIA